ncbi:MAG: DUF3516 domain-containing protein, partial [Actinobacteria bacterium]
PGVNRQLCAFRVCVPHAIFPRVGVGPGRRHGRLGEMGAESGWDAERWAEAMERYFAEYDSLGTGPDARGPALFMVEQGRDRWTVRQIFDDPEGDHDWAISAEVDLRASDEAGTAVIRILDVGPMSS